MRNYIPNEIKTFNDKDPPWITNEIKGLINETNIASKKSKKSLNHQKRHKSLQRQLKILIEKSKRKYYFQLSKKLTNPETSAKTYWSVLKGFLTNKKIPCIPPILHDNRFVTNFKEKAELFNSFFAKQCTILDTGSKLPTSRYCYTNNSLSFITFTDEDIEKIINKLNPNKSHGHDMISIRMLKICGKSICKPLRLIFQDCIDNGIYPLDWKKANVVPAFKKNDKQSIKNYRPISLLPICGKIFERVLFNNMFSFFMENQLISEKQSGFKPGDSCTFQLLSIVHEIYQSFDDNYEVRGVFLDISKAFDKVWHEGLIFKLKQNGISGKLLILITDFLKNRKQRVVLNGQVSSWADIQAGVPQGSILGPLFFLIYINDLSNDLSSDPKMFADDTSLFSVVHNTVDSCNNLNNDLNKISDWAYQWKMSFNPDISKQAQEVIFSRKKKKVNHPNILFNNSPVIQSQSQKHLGMFLDSKLDFSEHFNNTLKKINKTIGLLRKLRYSLPRSALVTIYKSFIRPHIDYGDIVYDQAYNDSFHEKLESIQYNASLAITGAIRGTSRNKLYQELGLESLQHRRWYRKLTTFYKIVTNQSPPYLFNLIPVHSSHYITRSADDIPPLKTKHEFFKNTFFPSSIKEWNILDVSIRNSDSLALFKKKVLSFIRPTPNSVFNCHHPEGIILLTRLRLGFSHLREHKFRHNFQDTINPICFCGQEIETTIHFLLNCPQYATNRKTFLDKIRIVSSDLIEKSDNVLSNILLFGDTSLSIESNTFILNSTIEFLVETRRFDEPLF